MKETHVKEKHTIDWPITIICVAIVFVFVIFMAAKPDATLAAVNKLFDVTTAIVGVPILWFVFLGLFFCGYLAFGKYGKIKLGSGKPDFSLFSYISMMICAALAATAVFYSFIEWSYYYTAPAFGIEANTTQAANMSLPYAFFHWGFSVQVIFVLTAVAMSYAVYVRKVPVLRVSAICESMMGDFKYKKPLGKVIDAITILAIVGGMGVSLGLGVPLISAGIAKIFGIQVSFTMNVIIILAVASIFSLSSFVGVEKGMRKLSDGTIYLAIAFIAFIFIFGPTGFIVKNFTQSMGTMITNYVNMSLFTDPIGKSGFPEANTIFLFTLALNYAALMGVFITKISKGRTIKEVVLTCLIGISLGTWVMFGVNGSFTMHTELTGGPALSTATDGQAAVFETLSVLPGGKLILPIVFTVVAIGFLATSLDSAAFSLSATATRKLDKNGNTSPTFRLFWCLVLALVPLSIMFSNAPFGALKTLCIFLSVPFLLVIIYMNIGLMKWLKKDENGVQIDPENLEETS
ncbi:MAG: BCCT family transporter [Clostridiales Family XIII bacterium]|nr:BCCT family transporter [Clostridiales Family XIII bacterium]